MDSANHEIFQVTENLKCSIIHHGLLQLRSTKDIKEKVGV
jgi:hypothetical protein